MTYEEAKRYVTRGEYAKANEKILEALDKQIPVKPEDDHHCPRCGRWLPEPRAAYKMCASCYYPKHCPDCGQRITWSEEE